MRRGVLLIAGLGLAMALLAPTTVAQAAPGERLQRQTTERDGLFEDVPIPGLVIALSLAALIGGAGGFIYAGIMGPNRQL